MSVPPERSVHTGGTPLTCGYAGYSRHVDGPVP
jgi:hypothetical protein